MVEIYSYATRDLYGGFPDPLLIPYWELYRGLVLIYLINHTDHLRVIYFWQAPVLSYHFVHICAQRTLYK